jgi:Fur family peroxide stress response transcriptional regulator
MVDDLREVGLRITPQRLAILKTFAGDTSHPTAQELFERLRPEFPSMSFATVYKTLDALARTGLSGTVRIGTAARFDPNTEPHHHLVCEACGAVLDLPVRSLNAGRAATRRIARVAPGFSIRSVERIYRGTCERCTPLWFVRPGPGPKRKTKERHR